MRFKRGLVIALLATITISFYGCSNGSSSVTTKPSTTVSATTSDYKGKITIWTTGNQTQAVKAIAKSFKKVYPNLTLNIVEVDSLALLTDLNENLEKATEKPDILLVDDAYVSAITSKYSQLFADMGTTLSKISNKYVKSVENLEHGSNIKHAVPWDNVPMAMYYRTDIYQKYGININEIITWKDFLAAGKKIFEKSKGTVASININSLDILSTYNMLMSELGGSAVDSVGRPNLNSVASLKVITLMKKMYDANICRDVDYNGLTSAISDDSIASVAYSDSLTYYLETEQKNQYGNWEVKKLPAFEAGGSNCASTGGSAFLIYSKSTEIAIAKEFVLKSVSDTELLSSLNSNYGVFPAYKPVFETDYFTKSFNYFYGESVMKLFSEISSGALEVNYYGSDAEISKAVKNTLSKIIKIPNIDETSIKDILDEEQSKAEAQWLKDNPEESSTKSAEEQ